jgi:hypothetical protein
VKNVKRIGHGFRNLCNYRLRLLPALRRCHIARSTRRETTEAQSPNRGVEPLHLKWTADSAENRVETGADTFVFTADGQIRVQTVKYTPQPKGWPDP